MKIVIKIMFFDQNHMCICAVIKLLLVSNFTQGFSNTSNIPMDI